MQDRSLQQILTVCLLVLGVRAPVAAESIVRPIERPDDKTHAIVLVQFRSGGHLDTAARGLAVVDQDGRGVPYRLLEHDPAGQTSLAVELPGKEGSFYLHYRRTPLPEAVVDATVPVSLVMRTFALPHNFLPKPKEIMRLVRTTRSQGTALVRWIFHAHNPFGSNQRFITDLQGLLDIPKTATYHLFSANNDAAYVYIDGKLVIGHDGPWIVRDAHELTELATPIHLEKGTHALHYIHVQRTDRSLAILGHVTGEQALPLPPHFFVHHSSAVLGPASSLGSSPAHPAVGFDAVQLDQIAHADHVYTRFRLTPIAPPSKSTQYRWQFGDGTVRHQPDSQSFEHVFVSSHTSDDDQWRVILELADSDGKSIDTASSFLSPTVFNDTLTIRNTRLVQDYARAVGRCEYPKASANHMMALYMLVKQTEQPALIASLAEPFVKRFGTRRDKMAMELKYTLATHLARDQPQRAAELYGEIARTRGSDSDSWRSTCAAAEQLDLFIFRLGQTENLQKRIGTLLSRRPPREIALLKSRIGDLHRIRGDVEAATKAYHAAQIVAYRQLDPRRADVLQSSYRKTAHTYLKQDRWPALRDVLFHWEADFPTAKLGSDLPLLTGRYFQAVGDDLRAMAEFKSLLELNPLHSSRPEIVYRLARSMEKTGHRDEARKLDKQLAEEYPKSPFVAGRD